MDTRILNRDVAVELEKQARELFPEATVRLTSTDTYHKLEGGGYSDVYTCYAVEISLRDQSTGNGEVRVVDSTDANIPEILADMRRKLRVSGRRTRRAIAVEKAMDAE